ncbi:SH3 domain-containing protein, partial [Streptococcus vestibularis]|uniref:SH3 domain-containing protein n=1 Tax=Streptococcus vestibularis TaxID=1343 RepID=UPI00241C09FD
MKNKISHKFLLSIITVSSLVLLGACSTSSQKQTSETKPTVESSKVKSSSSKVKSPTKDSSKSSSSSKQVKEPSNNASSNSNSSQNNNDASSSVASNNSQPSSPSSSQPASNSPSTQATKNATPTAPIDSGISVSGSYQTTQQTPVKNSPSVNAPVEFYLDAGSNVNYDMKVVQDGHEWLSYISSSGIRRYVQADNNSVTTPIDSGISVSGSYQTVQQTPVKNSPSVNAPIEFYL